MRSVRLSAVLILRYTSVQTTERYLGGKQEIAVAVNDHLPLGGE
jgi:hypothetical protein